MWYEELGNDASWTKVWSQVVLCVCGGIRDVAKRCPACGADVPETTCLTFLDRGREVQVALAFMGAEGRYEDYVFLKMLEREWKRPLNDSDLFLDIPEGTRPAPRSAIVILFWTYFETRIERLMRFAMRTFPEKVIDEMLSRNSAITARLERLSVVLLGATYWQELENVGFGDVASLLKDVREARNRFTHGSPAAINDNLVERLIGLLKREHESWIAVYNRCVAANRNSKPA